MSLIPLLQIKAFREQRAAAEVHRRRLVMAQYQRLVEETGKKLRAYQRYRREQEDTGFDAVRGLAVNRQQLEDLRAESARLREAEALLHQELLAAEEKWRRARAAWEEGRRIHAAAVREKEKVQQLVQWEQEEAMAAQSRREEAELEEYATPIDRL